MVKFGQYIKDCAVQSYHDKYIEYDELKILLGHAKSHRLHAGDSFYRRLESCYVNVRNFADEWIKGIESQNNEWSASTISSAIELNQFVYLNEEGFRKIIKKHDKVIPNSQLMSVWRWKLDFQFTQRIVDVILAVIRLKQPNTAEEMKKNIMQIQPFSISIVDASDDIEIGLSMNKNPIHAKPDPAELSKQTDSFVRQSTKYWVQPCDLAAVCAVLGENLHVHAFEKGGSPWSPISSVYLDNKKRTCYGERILKNNGARIARLRIYNNDTKKIWIERKVHHEKWTGETSSKDRFPIEESQVMQLLRGQNLAIANKHMELMTEIKTMVREQELYPTLRVDYTRIAFQPETHDHVRVSIDVNMRFLQERTSHMDWRTPDETLLTEDEMLFPYSIVEIKLREPYISDPPKWLQDLQRSSLLHLENNFSKYIHGTFVFGEVNGLKLRRPLWINTMKFTSPQMAIESVDEDLENKKALAALENSSASHWFAKLMGVKAAVDVSGKPIKIEPKVFFANERTFLSWFNCSIFVASIGVAISAASTQKSIEIAGGAMVAVGVIIVIYAALTFLQRTSSLLQRKSAGYHDRYGPVLLGTVVIIAFLLAFGLSYD